LLLFTSPCAEPPHSRYALHTSRSAVRPMSQAISCQPGVQALRSASQCLVTHGSLATRQ
jgi:hypothetical protein